MKKRNFEFKTREIGSGKQQSALYRELEDVEYFILDIKIFEKGKGKFVVVRIFLSSSSSNLVKIPRTCLPFPR